jgi:hypothetical protein
MRVVCEINRIDQVIAPGNPVDFQNIGFLFVLEGYPVLGSAKYSLEGANIFMCPFWDSSQITHPTQM